jgi:drug/metabolite transporter (DMT)-like permease
VRRKAIGYALLSAALFGASTPLAKLLVGTVPPLVLAAVLYLGSGAGLLLWLGVRRALSRAERPASLGGSDYLWLAAAIGAGGVIAPILLVFGLVRTDGATAIVGFLGYGVSLVLFIVALRHLGTARTGAYFSVAPFFGAALALLVLEEETTIFFWIAGALMALGVRLHLTERHEHQHRHETVEHTHAHTHDEHHQHEHEQPWGGEEPHAHQHRHEALIHSHPHYPDLHHRHRH